MSTWHQQQRAAPLWHPTKWTLVEDGPNQHTCVQRFETMQEALSAQQKCAGYILSPGGGK